MIEMMVVTVILAVLLAMAVPSMREFAARKRVEGVAQELATDLRLLKSQQIQRRQLVVMAFSRNASVTCYSLYQEGPAGDSCDCTNPLGACPDWGDGSGSLEIKTVVLPISSGVTLDASPDSLRLFGFNAMPVGNATIRVAVRSTTGGAVQVSTNPLAMPVMCSISGSSYRLPAC